MSVLLADLHQAYEDHRANSCPTQGLAYLLQKAGHDEDLLVRTMGDWIVRGCSGFRKAIDHRIPGSSLEGIVTKPEHQHRFPRLVVEAAKFSLEMAKSDRKSLAC